MSGVAAYMLWLNRPFYGFLPFDMDKLGIIRRHHWKERLKSSKAAKFESDLLKPNENIAPQSREILQTFVWWGHKLAHHQTNVCKSSKLCGAISLLA